MDEIIGRECKIERKKHNESSVSWDVLDQAGES